MAPTDFVRHRRAIGCPDRIRLARQNQGDASQRQGEQYGDTNQFVGVMPTARVDSALKRRSPAAIDSVFKYGRSIYVDVIAVNDAFASFGGR
jgi:hypothetical protein